jgi:hypothetical protein
MDQGSKKSIKKNKNFYLFTGNQNNDFCNVQAYYFCTDCFSLGEVKYLGAIIKQN